MASTATGPVRKKTVHHLGSPFTVTSWPEISQDDQDTILELLCDYLSPIGKHRRAHIKSSNGKRAEKKRKRQIKESGQDGAAMVVDTPAKPEIASQVDVGFNLITTHLQSVIDKATDGSTTQSSKEKHRYSMIFVCRGNQTAPFNSHFPQMVAASSRHAEPGHAQQGHVTRLIGFSKPCSDRLSASLGIARVSSVAIRVDAMGTGPLRDIVEKTVKPVLCDWLHDAQSLQYRQSQIISIETHVGAKKAKQVVAV